MFNPSDDDVESPPPGRSIADPPAVRAAVFDSVLRQAGALPAAESERHVLLIENPAYDSQPQYSAIDRKRAIMSGSSLSWPLSADVVLRNKADNSEVDRRRMLLARVPYLTNRGFFVDGGSQYVVKQQMRLRPGIFARRKNSGELESQVNIMPGQGVPHRLQLEPETGKFRVEVGKARLPLLPLLRAMGASDEDIQSAWGPELLNVNKAEGDVGLTALRKIYHKIVLDGKAADESEIKSQIRERMEKTRLDPEVTQRTLGEPLEHINSRALLLASRKLLAIHNRNDPDRLAKLGLEPADEDSRDHPAFMTLMGVEDVFSERLKAGAGALRKILWNAESAGSLKKVPSGFLSEAVRAALLKSGLGQVSESINPLQVLDQRYGVTRMGVGGIASSEQITDEARGVQASHRGLLDPILTPESDRAGVDIRATRRLRKDADGNIYAPFRNVRTGVTEWLRPHQLYDAVVTGPDPLPDGTPETWREVYRRQQAGRYLSDANGALHVSATAGGRQRLVPINQVTHQMLDAEDFGSPLTNLVALKSSMKPQRVSMAARMMTQALPLEKAEAPLVRSGDKSGRSFEEIYSGEVGVVRADQSGTVVAVSPTAVKVRYDNGETKSFDLSRTEPNNRKTYHDEEPAVAAGQRVSPGQVLVRSNYSDADGNIAIGLNVRTGYMPFKGLNYEDAVVISQSLADRMRSQHLYQHAHYIDSSDVIDKPKWLGSFTGRFSGKQLDNIDDSGVVKVGTVLKKGDPLFLGMTPRDVRHGVMTRGKAAKWQDISETWDHNDDGLVTDVFRGKGGLTVAVKASSPTVVGDKLSGRHGNKGVISAIVPDSDMPIDSSGKPLELIYNDLGVTTRTNPSQVVEAWLGKVAAATGKPYIVRDRDDILDNVAFAEQELRKHGMPGQEDLTDPVSGARIPRVLTGNTFVMKLHHSSEHKLSNRAFGGYDMTGAPAKGGHGGAKTWGMLAINALLSSGATGVITEGSLVRGQRNPEWWAAFMQGKETPPLKVPEVYQRWIGQLKGAGVNFRRDRQNRIHIMAMTDADVKERSGGREPKRGETVDWNGDELVPIRGGLFDPEIFGAEGERWGQISLPEPLPNPVMEEPIRRVLRLTEPALREILAGRRELNGQTGPRAVQAALTAIDVDKEIELEKQRFRAGKPTVKEDAVRRLRSLTGAKKTGVLPANWMLTAAPVLPPRFRPVSMMDSGSPLVADANYLYRDLMAARDNFVSLKGRVSDLGDERLAIYDSFKAVVGLGDPSSDTLEKQEVKGLLRHVFGGGPKHSILQRKVLGSTTDLVGRATIIPNPDLTMDEVAIPEAAAWDVFQPVVVRQLVQRGMGPAAALKAIENKTTEAREALQAAMSKHPVVVDRAPVLHKYGELGAWARLTRGNNLEISPVVTKGLNADFDGDAMQFHVQVTPQAIRDTVNKLMPSKQLESVARPGQPMYLPNQEYVTGLYLASTRTADKRPVVFRSAKEAIAAFRDRGEIDFDTPLLIQD